MNIIFQVFKIHNDQVYFSNIWHAICPRNQTQKVAFEGGPFILTTILKIFLTPINKNYSHN